MLNAIGLQNVGVEEFIARKAPAPSPLPSRERHRQRLRLHGGRVHRGHRAPQPGRSIAAYELNVSCPNVHAGGMAFGAEPAELEYLVSRASNASTRPLIVKLSPNVTSIAHMARIAARAGANALSVSNTFLAMAIDAETASPAWPTSTGGLSGPAIKPITLRMVYETAQAVDIPSSHGGIITPADAVEYLLAGATRRPGWHSQLRRPLRRRAPRQGTRILVPQPRSRSRLQPHQSPRNPRD